MFKECTLGIRGYNCWLNNILGAYLTYADKTNLRDKGLYVYMKWVFKLS